MIYEYQKLAAQDVRFDVPLADACMDDRMKYCGNVQPVRPWLSLLLQTLRPVPEDGPGSMQKG
jgi:hypothetical protein